MSRFERCPANDDKLGRGADPCYDWAEYHCDGCNIYEAYLMGIAEGISRLLMKEEDNDK